MQNSLFQGQEVGLEASHLPGLELLFMPLLWFLITGYNQMKGCTDRSTVTNRLMGGKNCLVF